MVDYSVKQKQDLFTDEERARMGLSSRETLKRLASMDISYQPPGLGTDPCVNPTTRESWRQTVRRVHSAVTST